jgi:quercetin dioxygenase-like cupin family protein
MGDSRRSQRKPLFAPSLKRDIDVWTTVIYEGPYRRIGHARYSLETVPCRRISQMQRQLSLLVAAPLVLALTGAAIAQQATAPVQPTPVKRTPVGKIEVPGSNYEVITAVVELQPGFKAGRHTHPGSVMGQVVEGELMIAIEGQPEKIVKAGQSVEVPNGAIHDEGPVGPNPVKIIAVYVVEKGKPLVQPVK